MCLLSQVELRATPTTVSVAARSSRAASNLAVHASATLVSWAGRLHYIGLARRARFGEVRCRHTGDRCRE